MNSSVPAVHIIDLTKSFGSVNAVSGLSLEAARGQITAILGPNGAGKTTTLEICEGHQAPDGGSVRVLGLDPQRDEKLLRTQVGVMLQEGGMPTSVNADTLLRHVASFYGSPLPVDALADRLGIAGFSRTPIRRLSGGEQRRVAFALAIIGRPELVILDEPTSGLDPQSRAVVWQTVEELRSKGVSVLLTSHLLDEVERVADQVVIVDHGRVISAGTPGDLIGQANIAMVRSESPIEVRALAAHLQMEVTELAPHQYCVSGDVFPSTAESITAWCSEHSVALREVSVRRRTLDDVFLELTGRDIR